jgi:uncharacterized tellurite resistance protein B-like protein
MFANLITRFRAPAPLPAPQAPLALAALMVRLARSDGAYEAAEIANIDRALVTTFALPEAEATVLRQRAEALEAESPDTVRFTRALKDTVPKRRSSRSGTFTNPMDRWRC